MNLTVVPRFDDAVPLSASQQQLRRPFFFTNIKLRFRFRFFSHGLLIWTSAFPYCAVFHLQCSSSSLCTLRFVGCSKLLHIAKVTGWLPLSFVAFYSFRNVSSDSLVFLHSVLSERFSNCECPTLFLFCFRYHWSLSCRTCTRLTHELNAAGVA